VPFGVSSPRWYRPIGSAIPLRRSSGLEVFPTSEVGVRFVSNASPPLDFPAPSEYDRSGPPPANRQPLSWGFVPYSVSGSRSPVTSGLPHPTSSDFRVSHPLAGLRLPEPSGLVSCRLRSWGSPSGLLPLAEPSIFSEPVTFVALLRLRCNPSDLERHSEAGPCLQGFALCVDSTPQDVE